MADWKLFQFDNVVNSFLENCSAEMQEVLLRRLDSLSVTGNMSKRPISAPLKDGLFELRGQAGSMQARLIYFFDIGKKIVFVHSLYKSGSQISRKDLEIAKQNRKLIKEEKEEANGLNLTH